VLKQADPRIAVTGTAAVAVAVAVAGLLAPAVERYLLNFLTAVAGLIPVCRDAV
jgi:hypothetical protein